MKKNQQIKTWRSRQTPSFDADGEVQCPACGFHCLQWHDVLASFKGKSVTIRTRCESCLRVSDLHLEWYKGSIYVEQNDVGPSEWLGDVEPLK